MHWIGTLIGIIFALVIAGFIWWALQKLLGLIPLAEPFATLVQIAMMLIMILIVFWVIIALLSMVGISVPLFGLR